MLNLKISENDAAPSIGNGDLYRGQQYKYPYFFEGPNKKMMVDMSDKTIDFKTWKGEYFQFTIGKFHGNNVLTLTSTLRDYCVFRATLLSVDGMVEWVEKQANRKHYVNGSFSGYYSFGKNILERFDILKIHMEDQGIYFSDEMLEWVYRELIRRTK